MIKPEEVLNTMTPEQCARYLDHRLLWSFATARPVWHGIRKGVDPQILRAESDYLAVILFSALKHGLITETDVVDGIGVGELRKLLFSWQQEDLFDKIRESCGTGTSIDHVILEKITLITVVRRIPKILWGKVVNPKIEVVYGLWSTRPRIPRGPVRTKSRIRRTRSSTVADPHHSRVTATLCGFFHIFEENADPLDILGIFCQSHATFVPSLSS